MAMLLQSPEDPEVTNLIQDDAEAQLALFLSKTLTNAIMMYRQGGPGPIGPPNSKPGPIGPPRSKGGMRGGRGAEFNEFYADTPWRGVAAALGGEADCMASVSPCCSTTVVLVPLSTTVEAWNLRTRGNMKMAAKATGDSGSHLHKFTKVYAYCRFRYRKENFS